MKSIVLTLILSYGCVSICFSNTNLDSLYKKAFHSDSISAVIGLIPDFEEICKGDDLVYLCKVYFLIGYRASNQKMNALAFSYYEKSFEIAKKIGDYDRQRSAMLNISNLHYTVDDFVTAKEYMLRAIEYAEKAEQENKVASYLCDIGTYLRKEGQIDSAIYYLQLAYDKEVKHDNHIGQALVLNEFGLCAYEVQDYSQAIEYFYMALEANDTSNYIKSLVYNNHSLIALKKGELFESKGLLNKSIEATKLWSNDNRELIPQLNLLGEIYMESQQYDSALVTFMKALELNDYNGLKGANSEELYLTMRFLYQIQAILDQKYLLTDLGVYEKYGDFLQWQVKNQNELDKLNNRMILHMTSERIRNEKQMTILKSKLYWLAGFVLVLGLGVWWASIILRRKKKEILLRKMELFEEEFENRYDSAS